MEIKPYTITVFTENHIGLLNHITIIFTRRKINIESLTVSESQIEGIHSFTILVHTTRDKAEKVIRAIERLVEVLKAFVYEEEQIISQEIALYKIPTKIVSEKGVDIGQVVRENHARILDVFPEFIVIEKTGTKEETQSLLCLLREQYSLLEFGRSGRIAVTKPMKELEEYLREMEAMHDHIRE